jgi:hypothetical protein
MKNDRPKYMPDVAKILRDNEPAAFEARQRKALAKVYAAGLIDRLTPEPVARVSAPSPWAKDEASAGAEIDAGALPSATMPAAEERPVTKAAERTVRTWPATWKLIAGCALLAVAMPVLVLMAGRSKEPNGQAAGTGSAMPAVVPSVAATEVPALNGVAIPSATADAPASVTATPQTTAVPAPGLPRKQTRRPPDPKQEPTDPAPPPSAAVAPAPSTVPSVTTPDTAPTSTRWF